MQSVSSIRRQGRWFSPHRSDFQTIIEYFIPYDSVWQLEFHLYAKQGYQDGVHTLVP